MNTNTNEYQIYVADLADYNAGLLSGFWLNVSGLDAEDIKDNIADWLESLSERTGELHEEFAIHDYDNLPNFGEWPDFEEIAEYVRLTEEHGEAFEVWYENLHDCCGSFEDWESNFEEVYVGYYKDGLSDYAYELVQEGAFGDVSGSLMMYIDYDMIARTLDSDGYTEEDGYVFRPY